MKKENKSVIIWLLSGCFLIFIMVVVGGITRLTNSGLSMTDWHLVTDTLPPLSEVKWQEAFEKYKQFPEYQKINSDMTLSFGTDELLMFRIENVMRLSLIPVRVVIHSSLVSTIFDNSSLVKI